jgi:hypothetical protein
VFLRYQIAGSLLVALHLFADPLDDWAWRNPLPTGHRLMAIAHGDSRFVAVGDAGTIAASTDATNWLVRQAPAGALSSVAYGNNRFVAVGGTIPAPSWIVVSANGTNWAGASPATTNGLYAVTFGGGLFVAGGENETIVTSTDGTNWIKRHETPLGGRFVDVAYGNGLFMVANNNAGAVFTSTDGVNWSPRPAFGNGFRRLSFGNGAFLAENLFFVGPAIVSRLATSADGNSWIKSPLPPPAGASFIYDSTRFVLVGLDINSQSNVVFTSANGLNWTTTNFIDALPGGYVRALTFGGGQYVGVSDMLVRSPNLLQWSAIGSSLPLTVARVFLSGNGKCVLAGDGPILVSTNGTNYQTNTTTGTFRAGAFGTNTFILTAGGGSIVTSTNGSNWTARSTGGSSLNALAYGSNTFIAVGGNGDIRVSPNGSSWSGRFSGVTLELKSVTYGQGVFVVVGAGGTILTSPDTVAWTSQNSGTTVALTSVAFGNNVFFAVGDGGTILVSSDGAGWTPVASGASQLLHAAANRGNLLVAGFSTVLSSIDGMQWRPRRVPLSSVSAIGTTAKTFMLLGDTVGVVESGELSPVRLFLPGMSPVSGFQLHATGDPGTPARLQRSTNLLDWTDVLTFTNSGAQNPLNDSSATNSIRSFYRVVAP